MNSLHTGKSTLFNRLLCKESNRAYRLASEKKIRIKKGVSSTARVGASGTVRKKSNRGGAIVSDVPGKWFEKCTYVQTT